MPTLESITPTSSTTLSRLQATTIVERTAHASVQGSPRGIRENGSALEASSTTSGGTHTAEYSYAPTDGRHSTIPATLTTVHPSLRPFRPTTSRQACPLRSSLHSGSP